MYIIDYNIIENFCLILIHYYNRVNAIVKAKYKQFQG